jgi:hypothetical protein
MKRNEIVLNIDKVEICYTASMERVQDLKDTKYQEFDGFRILSVDSNNKIETHLQIDILYPSEDNGTLEWTKFAVLKIGSTFEDESSPSKFVWIKIENKALYTQLYPGFSILGFVYGIALDLGLTFNNITKLDIAIDVNYNSFVRVKKAIRNFELVPIVLGKAYTEPKEVIDKILYIHTADRIQYRTNSISISTKEKDLCLCIYNKSEEAIRNSKDYILDWDSMNGNIYRNEIRLKRHSILDYLDKNGMTFEDLYYQLNNQKTLFDMFLHYSNKVLRFRHGRELKSILEL